MRKWFLFIVLAMPLQIFSEAKWVNCIGNQICTPCEYCEPKTFEELCANIKNGASQGRTVRAIGNGYSISDIGCTDGWLLNLKHLNKIISIDTKENLVHVQAG